MGTKARSKDGRGSSRASDAAGKSPLRRPPLHDKVVVMIANGFSCRSILAIALPIAAMFVSVSAARAFDLASLLKNRPEKFRVIYADDLTKLMNDPSSHVNIYDANGPGLRNTAGIIPGARLLTSDDSYDVAKELPPDKGALVVFYCADRH